MQHQSDFATPPMPRSSVWAVMVLTAVFGFLTVIAIPQFIRSQARREVAQLKAIARASPDVSVARR